MTPRCEPVERYLDDLLGRLHGAPAEVRRMLAETELHLYAAVDDGLSAGLDETAAADEAVARFGPVERVAREWNAHAPAESLLVFARRLIGDLMPLAGVGLLAIGLSGVVARVMASIWGLRFVFADPPGTRYSSGECRYWLFLHPHAGSCTNAYLAESLADGTHARYAAGLIGLGLLAVVTIIRRRRGSRVFEPPTVLTAFTATALFAAAAIALISLGADDVRVSGGNGAGQWFSGAVIAIPIAVVYGWQFLSLGRRSLLTA
jgi:HAAS domain-containing protein